MRKRHWLAVLTGATISIVLFWLVFRAADAQSLMHRIRQADPYWITVAAAFSLLALILRAMRLRVIAEARGVSLVPFLATMQSTDFIDIVVPLKMGLPLRAMMLKRYLREPFSQTFAVSMVDRLMEAGGIFFVVLICILVWPTDGPLHIPAETFGTANPLDISLSLMLAIGGTTCGILAVAPLLSILLYRFGVPVSNLARRVLGIVNAGVADRFATGLARFSKRLHLIKTWPHLFRILTLNTLFWGSYLGSIHAVYLAFALDPPWFAAFMTVSFFMVSQLGPNAPAMIGQYHVAIVLAQLAFMPDVDMTTAKAVAVVVHFVHFASIVISGLWGLGLELRQWNATVLTDMFRKSLQKDMPDTEMDADKGVEAH